MSTLAWEGQCYCRLAACVRALMDTELGCTVTLHATAGGNNHAATGTCVPPGMHRQQKNLVDSRVACVLPLSNGVATLQVAPQQQGLPFPPQSPMRSSRQQTETIGVPGNRPRLSASCYPARPSCKLNMLVRNGRRPGLRAAQPRSGSRTHEGPSLTLSPALSNKA